MQVRRVARAPDFQGRSKMACQTGMGVVNGGQHHEEQHVMYTKRKGRSTQRSSRSELEKQSRDVGEKSEA